MKAFTNYKDRLESYSNSLNEPAWLRKRRLQALEAIEGLKLPKIERSNYDQWLDLNPEAFDRKGRNSSDALAVSEKRGPYIRSLHDQLLESYLPQDLIDQGVIFSTFQETLVNHADLLEAYWMTEVVNDKQDRLAAYHAAFMNVGFFLYIPKNVVVEEPIQLHMIQDASLQKPFNAHVLIVLEEHAEARFVEKTATEGKLENTASLVVEIIAKDHAKLYYSNVDNLGANTRAFIRRQAILGRQANVDWAIGSMSDGNLVLDAYTELRGEGSESDLKIVSITHGNQEQIVNSHVLNVASQSKGNIFQHGAVLDQSRLTFNAIGKIENGAKGADAQQESRLLMFSEGARGDANPILLIEEYEVAAGHAASVGQIDQEDLYYLMSRGIPEKEAMRLAIRGFLGPVIQAIPLEAVREDLVDTIERKLKSL